MSAKNAKEVSRVSSYEVIHGADHSADFASVAALKLLLEDVLHRSAIRTKEAYTYEEVAFLLSVSKRQVQQWIASGDLSSIDFPNTERLRRVTRAQLLTFIQQGEAKADFRRPRNLPA